MSLPETQPTVSMPLVLWIAAFAVLTLGLIAIYVEAIRIPVALMCAAVWLAWLHAGKMEGVEVE